MSSDARIRWSHNGDTLTASHDGVCEKHPREGHKYEVVDLMLEIELCLKVEALCWEIRVNEDGSTWLAGYEAR